MVQGRGFNEDVTYTYTVVWQGLENQQNGDGPRLWKLLARELG